MYSSTLSLTLALDEGGWSMPRPGHFTHGKDTVPIVQKAGWAPGPVWMGAENLIPPGLNPQTVQPIVSCYTNCVIPVDDIKTKWSAVTGHMFRMEETRVAKKICKASQKAEEK